MSKPGQPPLPIDTSTWQGQLGQILRDRRESLGYSMKEASTLLGISHQAVSRIERGIDTPRWSTLAALCRHYRLELTIQLPSMRVVARNRRRFVDQQKDQQCMN